jgi:DNA topoisomerase-1
LSQFKTDESRFEDSTTYVKEEDDSDEDIPLRKPFAHRHRLSARMDTPSVKRKIESDEDEDDMPLMARKKPKKEKKEKSEKKKKKRAAEDEEDWDRPVKKEKKIKKEKDSIKSENSVMESPKKGGRKKKEEEQQEVWKWWEEEKKDDGKKWKFLEHKGPVFAPPYEPLPDSIKFFYDGKEMKLSQEAEEVASFYAKMLDHDYTTKETFNNNFFKDWRKVMIDSEKAKIKDLRKCNFKQMHAYFMDIAEKNRNRTKEEKQALKEKNEALIKEYGFCIIDGHKEKIGNFKIEPPGLFRGRGEHPKMGMLKRRVEAEDIIINCSHDSKIPQPPPGHCWKEVRHDDNVTWLASWTENVQNQVKYIMLNPSSKLKGEKDWQKYETARRLHKCIDKIRTEYWEDWKSKEMRIRQRAVALYFIDKLALRAGNEKDEDQADTVGCCSLRVEHISLHEKKDGKEYVVVFDFLGKDSIRYYNEVPVEKRVFKNLQLFMEHKSPGDDLFDRLNTAIMNKHLNELMEGLTAKVFRTYNASWTLQQQLDKLTNPDDTVAEKILSYNRANRAVAILCNHQRSVPKGHEKSMEKLKEKIDAKKEAIKDAERQVKDAGKDAKHGSVKEKTVYDKKKKMLQRLKDQLIKLEIQETDRDENKTIALGTSKLNYLDPRISVAWCKKFGVPIEKIYNKTQRDKFRWAIDMAGPDYYF